MQNATDRIAAEHTSESEHRERCYVCFRPTSACFCRLIPTIANRTDVLILQHVKERFHAFNTARIVKRALKNCSLFVDQTTKLASKDLPLRERAAVLYPGADSVPLSELHPDARPQQLVILDGTWHHARTFMRDIPVLQHLPHVCLNPDQPGEYRIRKEPTDSALSTVEAAVQALSILEPETTGLNQLLNAFRHMVDEQIAHPQRSARLRLRKGPARPPLNIPSALLNHPANVVVAYGETSFGGRRSRTKQRSLIYWVAQRISSGENFECAIQSPDPIDAGFRSHLQLEESVFAEAAPVEIFRQRWQAFLRPDDQLFVFNESTRRALQAMTAASCPSYSLKSVNAGRGTTLDETLASLKLEPATVPQRGRAGQRLGNAIAYVRHLQSRSR